VIHGLGRLDQHAEALAGAIESGADGGHEVRIEPLAQQMEQQFSNYVMDQQRDAHRQAIAPTHRPRPPAAVPKARTSSAAPAPASKPSNVELF
jgi:hypothetical protein